MLVIMFEGFFRRSKMVCAALGGFPKIFFVGRVCIGESNTEGVSFSFSALFCLGSWWDVGGWGRGGGVGEINWQTMKKKRCK